MKFREERIRFFYSDVKCFYGFPWVFVKVGETKIWGTENPRVGSSILSLGTTKNSKGLQTSTCKPLLFLTTFCSAFTRRPAPHTELSPLCTERPSLCTELKGLHTEPSSLRTESNPQRESIPGPAAPPFLGQRPLPNNPRRTYVISAPNRGFT